MPDARTSLSAKDVIRRYYEQFWNRWDFDAGRALIAPNAVFRTDKGISARNRGEFFRYVLNVRTAFPDLSHVLEELSEQGGVVRARVAAAGTHTGKILGIDPGGRKVSYVLAAEFRVSGGRIVESKQWSEDRQSLAHQIAGVRPDQDAPSGPGLFERVRRLFRKSDAA